LGQNVTEQILAEHFVEGTLEPGAEIALRVDQTLTQDATGTMAYLQFEAMGVPRVRTELAVSYVDHNTLQCSFENADDHRYLASVAAKYGILFSRPGNGICHQVHLERFAAPGQTLLGSDSHTPTAGGAGMLAIGAGGLDVAAAMAGEPFHLQMPEVVGVRLSGALQPWVSAKDVILELLRRLSVKGGVGKVFEYMGPGVATLSVPQRATLTNMGAELGATTSVFPSDAATRRWLAAQGREATWRELGADDDARYAEVTELDLSTVEPLVAQPHSPDSVAPVAKLVGTPVDQIIVGSCTNSSYADLATVAAVLRGRKISPGCSFAVAPGSRQALEMIARSGALADLISAGARVLEAACGPCIGMGQAPADHAVSLRSFNRNFEGRSGTPTARIYLGSAETCVAAALTGQLTDPRTLGAAPLVEMPTQFLVDDSMLIPPAADPSAVEVVRGRNIAPLPVAGPLPDELVLRVLLKLGDNITTDDIMPAGAKILPLRSNVPALSGYVFSGLDPEFPARARAAGPFALLAGGNYGQGSSREHAALAPLHLGLRAVVAESFARIHRQNLVNFGILPLLIAPSDRDAIQQGDQITLARLWEGVARGGPVEAVVAPSGRRLELAVTLDARERALVLAGGLLNTIRSRAATE